MVFACAINLAVAARQIDLGGAGFQAVGANAAASFFTRIPELLRTGLPALTEKLSALLGKTGAVSAPDESWRLVIFGVVIVLMMVFRPEGLLARARRGGGSARRHGSRHLARQEVATLPYGIRKSIELVLALAARSRPLLLDNSAAGHDGTGASNLWPYSTASSTPGLRCRWLSIT